MDSVQCSPRVWSQQILSYTLSPFTWRFKEENQLSAFSSFQLGFSTPQLANEPKCFISVCRGILSVYPGQEMTVKAGASTQLTLVPDVSLLSSLCLL